MVLREEINVIVNPIAGFGNGRFIAKKVVKYLTNLGYNVRLFQTTSEEDIKIFRRQMKNLPLVICIGGDGTINKVLNILPEEGQAHLFIIPTGSGNVLAKGIGIAGSCEEFFEIFKRRQFRLIDVGVNRETGQKFISTSGAGFDAEVVRRLEAQRQNSQSYRRDDTVAIYQPQIHMHWNYAIRGLQMFGNYKLPRIRVEIDGEEREKEASFVVVCNVNTYGGPLTFIPDAKPDDGYFDVVIFRGKRNFDILRLFVYAGLSYLVGNALPPEKLVIARGKKVVLTSKEKVPLQLDGEIGGYLPALFEILHHKIYIAVLRK